MHYNTNRFLSKHKASVYNIRDAYDVDLILSALEEKELSEKEIMRLQVFSIKRIDYLLETDNFAREKPVDIPEEMEEVVERQRRSGIEVLRRVSNDILLDALELKDFSKNQAEKLQELVARKRT